MDEAALPSLGLVREGDMLDDVLFVSFSESALRTVKREEPQAHTGLIYLKPSDGILSAKRIGCEFVLPFYRMATAKAIAFAHRLKLRVVPSISVLCSGAVKGRSSRASVMRNASPKHSPPTRR